MGLLLSSLKGVGVFDVSDIVNVYNRRASAVWSRVKVGLRGSKLTRNLKDRIR